MASTAGRSDLAQRPAVHDARRVSSRPNRVLAIAVAVIALVAVLAGVVSSTRSATRYDRGTPEGVVQAYLEAVIDGDDREAAGLLAQDSECTVDDLDRTGVPDALRAVLRDTEVDGDTARVEVDLDLAPAGPLDSFELTEEHTFRLVRADGKWLIQGTPWPMFECSEER
jgi:hypothetical protein